MEKLKKIISGEAEDLKVLDIGTGVGFFIEVLKESLPGYRSIIGIDTKQEVLNKAREKYEDPRIQFLCMSGEEMDFERNSMDVVSISNTLHHLPNMDKVLNEIKRVLKPEGLLILNEMISDNQSEKQQAHVALHHLQGEIDTYLGICHNKTFTTEELERMVEELKLEKVGVFLYNTHEEQKNKEDIKEEKKILDEIFEALESKIQQISYIEKQEEYLEKVKELKNKLYPVGFFTATEIMMVCRKKELVKDISEKKTP